MWKQFSRISSLVWSNNSPALSSIVGNVRNAVLHRNFSIFSNIIKSSTATPILPGSNEMLLQPTTVSLNIDRGFKVKGRLRRRCKDCYFVMREERLYVICKTHPRHKQMSMIKKPKNTWILTDATQSKQRPF